MIFRIKISASFHWKMGAKHSQAVAYGCRRSGAAGTFDGCLLSVPELQP